MRQRLAALIVAGLLVLLALPATTTAAECEFILGFATLKALIDEAEGPDKVGECLENQRFNPENGDALQQTTGGLLVWRKADNWTAFTDGYRTWINGPHGLQARLNTEQFDWERPAVPAAAIPVPTVEIRTEYIVQCSNGIVVRNPQANLGLVADCAALLQGRDTLDTLIGDDYRLLNWRANRSIADWHIVTVSGSPRRVTALQYSPHPKMIPLLTGAIPPELGALTSLRRLELDGANRLTGPIPPELGALTNLESLSLHFNYNQLTGPIPPQLGTLTQLRELSLHGNLTGPIPPQLGGLTNLESLSLSFNRFDNQLTGPIPPQLGRLTQLRKLSLSGNLTGLIPPELGALINLQRLWLNGNQLTGPIPSQLGALTNLQDLSLYANQLTGPIPPELGALTNLQQLRLDNNQLTGSIPPQLGILSKLEELRLSTNQLTGPIPSELGNLAILGRLALDNNQLTGPIPPRLGALANLRHLLLRGNALTGCLPGELLVAAGNVGLPLCGPDYTAQCSNGIAVPSPQDNPGLIVDCRALLHSRDTLAGHATLNWSADRAIADWDGVTVGGYSPGMRVTTLNLSQHQLTGSIPPQLGALDLQELDLRGNQLAGPIPPQLGALDYLRVLRLDNNRLTGPIPPQLGSLADLQVLSLSFNRLTGTVPTQFEFGDLAIKHFEYLFTLRASGRHHHPRHWGALLRLQHLDLSHNQLTGPIPSQLGSLPSLEVLLLDRNQLTGCLPPALRRIPENDFEKLGLPFCES